MGENVCSRTVRKPRSPGLFAWTSLLVLSIFCTGCKPTGPESAGAAMIVSPAVFLGGLIGLAILRRLWRPLIGPTQTAPKLHGVTFGVLVALSLIGYFAIPGASEWAGVGLWALGTSYGSVLLLVWRIWLHKKPETSFSHAPVATLIVQLSPIPILVFAPLSEDAVGGITTGLWLLPGGLGYATFPLFMMAVFEAIGRRTFPKESPKQDSKPKSGA